MPRLVKPEEKLNDSINTPVNHNLKQRLLRVAKAKGIVAHTNLSRAYIQVGVERDEKKLQLA